MANYFRITAYHPAENVCAVFDSNGRFEKLWQFSAFLVQKGFKIVEVGSDDKFHESFLCGIENILMIEDIISASFPFNLLPKLFKRASCSDDRYFALHRKSSEIRMPPP